MFDSYDELRVLLLIVNKDQRMLLQKEECQTDSDNYFCVFLNYSTWTSPTVTISYALDSEVMI